VFFRPEEIHGTSGIRDVLEPLPEGNGHVSHHISGFCLQNDPIPDLHPNGLSTIQARGIDLNRLAREKPANRQRFKSSLAEPFLLTIDGNAVLGGEIVEGSEGGNKIGIGKEPSRDPGSEKLTEGFSPFFDRDSELGCNLGVMRRLASLYHSPHDDMKSSVKIGRFTHELTS
jgi:hypothetical protein